MQFFRKAKEYFTGKTEEEDEAQTSGGAAESSGRVGTRKQQVLVPRRPVLESAGYSGNGGVQGLDWYKARMKTDVDGDLADEFLIELSRKNEPPDKPLKVQQRHVRDAALQNADLFVNHGSVIILEVKKPVGVK